MSQRVLLMAAVARCVVARGRWMARLAVPIHVCAAQKLTKLKIYYEPTINRVCGTATNARTRGLITYESSESLDGVCVCVSFMLMRVRVCTPSKRHHYARASHGIMQYVNVINGVQTPIWNINGWILNYRCMRGAVPASTLARLCGIKRERARCVLQPGTRAIPFVLFNFEFYAQRHARFTPNPITALRSRVFGSSKINMHNVSTPAHIASSVRHSRVAIIVFILWAPGSKSFIRNPYNVHRRMARAVKVVKY